MKPKVHVWSEIDFSENPKRFISYLDKAYEFPFVQKFKAKALHLLALQEGDFVLELGCGTGRDASEMASRVGKKGGVIAVDSSKGMILDAKTRYDPCRLPLQFQQAHAHQLPFEDGIFSACFSDRVFQHLENPLLCMNELRRVMKKQSRIVVCDVDWTSLHIHGVDEEIFARIRALRCRSICNPSMGRQLNSLLQEADFDHIQVSTETVSLDSLDTADPLLKLTETLALAQELHLISEKHHKTLLDTWRAGSFSAALTGSIAYARKSNTL